MGRDDKNKYTMNITKFIAELQTVLGRKYHVILNESYDDYNTSARILIFRRFACDICDMPQDFQDLVAKHNFKYDFVNCSTVGLWRK